MPSRFPFIIDFKKQFGTRLNEITKNNQISEIQCFARDLLEFMEVNKEPELLRSAYDLDRFSQQFDIKMIEKTLKHLQEV